MRNELGGSHTTDSAYCLGFSGHSIRKGESRLICVPVSTSQSREKKNLLIQKALYRVLRRVLTQWGVCVHMCCKICPVPNVALILFNTIPISTLNKSVSSNSVLEKNLQKYLNNTKIT